ncbi:hypothetical protein ACJX0J_029719, partial [Zea mays]
MCCSQFWKGILECGMLSLNKEINVNIALRRLHEENAQDKAIWSSFIWKAQIPKNKIYKLKKIGWAIYTLILQIQRLTGGQTYLWLKNLKILPPSELLTVDVFSDAYYPTWMADDVKLSPKNLLSRCFWLSY